jgi:hypothetical protein
MMAEFPTANDGRGGGGRRRRGQEEEEEKEEKNMMMRLYMHFCFFNYATGCNHAKISRTNATSPGILDTIHLFDVKSYMHIHNVQCDVQSTKCYINMSALMQLTFKFLSSASNNRHLILALKCFKIPGLKKTALSRAHTLIHILKK